MRGTKGRSARGDASLSGYLMATSHLGFLFYSPASTVYSLLYPPKGSQLLATPVLSVNGETQIKLPSPSPVVNTASPHISLPLSGTLSSPLLTTCFRL